MIRSMGEELPLSPALPPIWEMDFAGTVEAVGEGVTNYQVGDEVYGCAGGLADLQGALAEYINAGFDIVYDSVGGPNMEKSFNSCALNGQVVTTVSLVELDLSVAHFKGLSIHVVFMLVPMLHNVGRAEHGRILSELTRLAEAGHLKPVLDDNEYSLEQVGKAHDRLSSGLGLGKVVIDVNS